MLSPHMVMMVFYGGGGAGDDVMRRWWRRQHTCRGPCGAWKLIWRNSGIRGFAFFTTCTALSLEMCCGI